MSRGSPYSLADVNETTLVVALHDLPPKNINKYQLKRSLEICKKKKLYDEEAGQLVVHFPTKRGGFRVIINADMNTTLVVLPNDNHIYKHVQAAEQMLATFNKCQ